MIGERVEGNPRTTVIAENMSNAQSQGGNVVMVKAMFGDVFGQRGDYSKGIVYGSRRKVNTTI